MFCSLLVLFRNYGFSYLDAEYVGHQASSFPCNFRLCDCFIQLILLPLKNNISTIKKTKMYIKITFKLQAFYLTFKAKRHDLEYLVLSYCKSLSNTPR